MSKPLELVYVEWIDSAGYPGWRSLEDIQREATPIVIESVGWVVAENDKSITLVSHVHKDIPEQSENVRYGNDALTIPKIAITVRRAARKR